MGKTAKGKNPKSPRFEAGREGMIKRQCTREYKIEPIERLIKYDILSLPPRAHVSECLVDLWRGISVDEASRMRREAYAWKRDVYPLCGVPDEMLPKRYSV